MKRQTHILILQQTLGRNLYPLALILVLTSALLLPAMPANAQEAPPANANSIFLPLAMQDDLALTLSPYAEHIYASLLACQTIGLNQVCLGSGEATVDNASILTQPGDSAALADGQRVAVVSPDADRWSVAVLRLQADATTPDQSLTLLAFGNVEITARTLFTGTGNAALLPDLRVADHPAPGAPEALSGILLYNPSDEEPLAATLNDAVITLETSAFVQATPGAAMTVAMVNGAVLTVEVGETSRAVIPGHEVKIPLNADGVAAAEPGDVQASAHDRLAPLRPTAQRAIVAAFEHPIVEIMLRMIPEYFTDVQAHAFYDDLAAIYASNVAKVYTRCVTEPTDARSVYGLMVLNRMLRSNPNLEPAYGESRFSQLQRMMEKCASFEMDFDSQVRLMSQELSYTSHVNAQGRKFTLDLNGEFFWADDETIPITHLEYTVLGGEAPGCTLHTIVTDGEFTLLDGHARLRGNQLRIVAEVLPEVPFEEIYYTCPPLPPTESKPLAWSPIFYLFHRDQLGASQPTGYVFKDWKYNGRKNFAETIYTDLTADLDGASITGDSYLVVIHTPQP